MARKEYKGAAPATTLSSGIDNSTTSIPLTDGTGYPTGGVGKFFIVIDRGLSNEEKIYCDSRVGNAITANASGRGADGTAASSHELGAVIEHVFTAEDADEANDHINTTGNDHHTQYLNTARHAAVSHTTAMLADDSVTDDKIEVSQRWEPGDLKWSARATPSTGWLLCDGAAVSRSTYADLFTAISTTYGAGDGATTFNVPDFRDQFVMAAGTANARGTTGGSKDAIAVTHGHTASSVAETQDHVHPLNHAHSMTGGNHSHAIDTEYGNRIGVTVLSGNHAIPLTSAGLGGQEVSFTDIDHENVLSPGEAGSTALAVSSQNGNSQAKSATHTHGVTVNSGGASGTNANLPPFGVGNCFIKI